MKKYPRSGGYDFKNFLKGILVLEVVAFAGCYFVWNRMNKSRPFRKSILDNFPYILEGYYSLGEKFDSTNNIRSLDAKIWECEKKQSS
jgi:hypothetical protein